MHIHPRRRTSALSRLHVHVLLCVFSAHVPVGVRRVDSEAAQLADLLVLVWTRLITGTGAPSRPRPYLIFALCRQISNELCCVHEEADSVIKPAAGPLSL